MYRYDAHDQRLLEARIAELRDQLRRHRAGELSADALRPLRLLNGLYIERNGPMLRVAIPYGLLGSDQLRALARVTGVYGRGRGHFTTRHNFQIDWLALDDAPEILAELARVQLHAIQSSGSCIRNISCDPLAGAAPDEDVDPRPWCELLRQWSAGHPAFANLPRKLKIAVCGAREDRALVRVHDIGLLARRDAAGAIGFQVLVGGGLGRNPRLAQTLTDCLPWPHLLGYCEAICRVYNRLGRRDDPYKARLKALVERLGIDEFRRRVEAERATIGDALALTPAKVERVARHFADKPYRDLTADDPGHRREQARNPAYAAWVRHHVQPHRRPGYAIATIALKAPERAPGDLDSERMRLIADWADDHSFGEIRVTQRQNLVLADVPQSDLPALWHKIRAAGLAGSAAGLLADLVACPGGDYCSLANARSAPLAQAIQARFGDAESLARLGPIRVNVSGCMNGCAHHAVADIGLRGIDKQGVAHYQIAIGGRQGTDARFAEVLGPAIPADRVPAALERLASAYLAYRRDGESFAEAATRLGLPTFRAALSDAAAAARAPAPA